MNPSLNEIYSDTTCRVLTRQTELHDVIEIHVDVPDNLIFTRDTYFHWLDLWLNIQKVLILDGYRVVMSASPVSSTTDTMLKFWTMFDMQVGQYDGFYYCYKEL